MKTIEGFVHLRGAKRCVVPGCVNHTDEGDFVGELCAPCHSYIVHNEGTHSQAYRNEVAKANLRSIAKWLSDNPGGALFIVEDRTGRKIEDPDLVQKTGPIRVPMSFRIRIYADGEAIMDRLSKREVESLRLKAGCRGGNT
jgi:hypothetical protein